MWDRTEQGNLICVLSQCPFPGKGHLTRASLIVMDFKEQMAAFEVREHRFQIEEKGEGRERSANHRSDLVAFSRLLELVTPGLKPPKHDNFKFIPSGFEARRTSSFEAQQQGFFNA